MTLPFYTAPDLTLWLGDSLAVLKTLPDASVQACITSPPFMGLRDYGTATWEGGDAACGHLMPPHEQRYFNGRGEDHGRGGTGSAERNSNQQFRSTCGHCGAVRIDQQIGLESTLSEYLDRLVAVFAEVRRVLKPDGLLHVEMGDSYAGAGYSNHANTGGAQRADGGKQKHSHEPTFKSKQLMLVPHRLAIALGDAGWLLRADNVWSRTAPMPESVRDRCTRSHSYVFMFAKQSTYYYDADAIAEPMAYGSPAPVARLSARYSIESGRNDGDSHRSGGFVTDRPSRNHRSVFTLNPEPFTAGDHYAVMPTALVKPLILCSTKPGDVVLDCFSGAGTTMLVARQLGRIGWGIELSEKYCAMSVRRLEGQTPAMNLEVPA